MSEKSLQLNDELINGVLDAVARHDPEAGEDSVLALQYLAAISGYVVAAYPGPEADRQALLDHLAAFARHVADDRTRRLQSETSAQPQAPKGRSVPTDDPAVGIWKPEK